MSATPEQLIQREYEKNASVYRELDEIIYGKILNMIEENNFFVMDVSHRIKESSSLKKKLSKKFGKYQSIYDITDLCGVRIICYFSDSVDEITESIRRIFVLDEKDSIDKRNGLLANQFGYISMHCICSLRPESGYREELCRIRFEIQIRTVLQHAWAEIEHDLGYKSDFGIPRAIRRNFSRVAGLLEIADDQFCQLRDSTVRYSNDVREKIADGTADDLPLDIVSLNEFARSNKQFLDQLRMISKQWNVDIIPASVDKYLLQLENLGIKSLGNLLNAFKEDEQLMEYLIKYKIEDMDLDIISESTIFRYLCRARLIKGEYSEDAIYSFYRLSYNSVRARQYTEKTLSLRQSYNDYVKGLDNQN